MKLTYGFDSKFKFDKMSEEKLHPANKCFIVVKVQYNRNKNRRSELTCGTMFLINPNILVGSTHVLNSKLFQPEQGYNKTYIKIDQPYSNFSKIIKKKDVKALNGIDVSYIDISEWELDLKNKLVFQHANVRKGELISYIGYKAYKSPINLECEVKNGIVSTFKCVSGGEDVKLFNANTIVYLNRQYTREDFLGLSGGPTVNKNGLVVGLNCFVTQKEKNVEDNGVYSIKIDEILHTNLSKSKKN